MHLLSFIPSLRSTALLCGFLLVSATASQAQTPPSGGALRFLASATFEDTATSTNYVYLLWQAEDPARLRGQTWQLYRKSGAASSTNSYERLSTLSLQTRPNILTTLINSMPAELGDPAAMADDLDALLGDLLPAVELTLGDKLSAAMQAAQHDEEIFRRMLFLSRGHPILATCLGIAAVAELPGTVSTFEMRAQSDASAAAPFDRTVGRVTIDLTSPTAIPAPGPPVEVPDTKASGHLNAKLRWGVPDPLRRVSPLTFGYNVYRMSNTFAEGAGYHTTPPSGPTMTSLLASDPDDVGQVNQLAALPTKLFQPGSASGEAGDLVGDSASYFITDSNGAVLDGNTPFNDGDQFYYFVAARDLLGRPGAVSDATLVTICDKMPPLAPIRVKISNQRDSSTGKADLKVAWSPNPGTTEAPDHYLVYRWENPAQMVAANIPTEYDPHQIGGPISYNPATKRYSLTDNGAGAPAMPADTGKTFWYSVRAVKSTACGDLPSGNSAPGFGVLRDRTGPDGAGGSITQRRYCPIIEFENNYIDLLSLAHEFEGEACNPRFVQVTMTRIDDSIQGATIFLYRDDPGGTLPTTYQQIASKQFSPGDTSLVVKRRVNHVDMDQYHGMLLYARDYEGAEDYRQFAFKDLDFVVAASDPAGGTQMSVANFEITELEKVYIITDGGFTGNPHNSVTPADQEINPIEIEFSPTAGAVEYKLYKRVDDGELILLEQAEYDSSSGPNVSITDEDLPASSAEICYFVQYFDEHGNPSPLAKLGCIITTSKVDLPVPILAQPTREGDTSSPAATLNWFCAENGVERFHVYISDGDTPVDHEFSSDLVQTSASITTLTGTGPAGPTATVSSPNIEIDERVYRVYETGRVGGNFGDPASPGSFSLPISVLDNREYSFFVRAVDPTGIEGESSNIVSFTWAQTAAGPEVPWPARSLPVVDPDFIAEIKAQYLDDLHGGTAAVRIGELLEVINETFTPGGITRDAGVPDRNPSSWTKSAYALLTLFRSDGDETALPFVLYRYQVANEHFPSVSNDITQVSPLIDRVRTAENISTNRIELIDPFLELREDPDDPSQVSLYVRDTQGVIRGATYVYLLVRFKENGEIDRTIPTNPLFIPF